MGFDSSRQAPRSAAPGAFKRAMSRDGGAGGTDDDDILAKTVAGQVQDTDVLKQFIINLTKELIKKGGPAKSAVSAASAALGVVSGEAMNVLSDYESEDDSHLFPQQQPLADTPAE